MPGTGWAPMTGRPPTLETWLAGAALAAPASWCAALGDAGGPVLEWHADSAPPRDLRLALLALPLRQGVVDGATVAGHRPRIEANEN